MSTRQNGIAMATLVVIISVMIILVSVITVTGFNTSNTARKLAFASELEMIQESVNSYKTDNEGDLPTTEFIVIDLTRASGDVLNQFQQNGEEITNNKVSLCKIDFTKLNVKSLTRGIGKTEDDVYAVSRKTGSIYYAKGLKIGSNTYYTLTDELKKLLKYNSKSSYVNVSDSVVFETNSNEWLGSGTPLSVKVKLPKLFSLVNISLSGSSYNIEVSNSSTEKFNEYTFNVYENCMVVVDYKNEKNEDKKTTYNVKNIDWEQPNLEIENISTVDNKKYIKIYCKDNISGIKLLKYDIGDFFFNKDVIYNSGIDIKENVIEVDDDVEVITILVEDNAGNIVVRTVDL